MPLNGESEFMLEQNISKEKERGVAEKEVKTAIFGLPRFSKYTLSSQLRTDRQHSEANVTAVTLNKPQMLAGLSYQSSGDKA